MERKMIVKANKFFLKCKQVREGRSTMDNIYVLQYIVEKELKEGGKIYAFFVNLKALFE